MSATRRSLEIGLYVLSHLRLWAAVNCPEALDLVRDAPEKMPAGRMSDEGLRDCVGKVANATSVLAMWGAQHAPEAFSLITETASEEPLTVASDADDSDETRALKDAVRLGFALLGSKSAGTA
jgi:hypothetical protein